MYIQSNNEARNCKLCCTGKSIIIRYFECECVSVIVNVCVFVCVDKGIQHAKLMRKIVI